MAFTGQRIPRKSVPEEVVYIKGTIKHNWILEPDYQFGPEGKWSCQMYLVGEELEKFRLLQAKTGIKNTLRNDEDGWYCNLSRKCSYMVNGKIVGRQPPEVFRMDGDTKIPITERVGWGSTGVAKCVLWSSTKFPGKNLRWEALRIDDFKPFTYEESTDDQGASLRGLGQQPVEELF